MDGEFIQLKSKKDEFGLECADYFIRDSSIGMLI